MFISACGVAQRILKLLCFHRGTTTMFFLGLLAVKCQIGLGHKIFLICKTMTVGHKLVPYFFLNTLGNVNNNLFQKSTLLLSIIMLKTDC